MPVVLLKIVYSWLTARRAFVLFGEVGAKEFPISIGLPQGSSLSPFLFIVYHADLIHCTGAFAAHVFADDLNVLIRAPITRKLEPMLQFLENEGSKVCNRLFEYACRWKQPINVSKTVFQIFYSQVKLRSLLMNNTPLECVKEFKYLGYTWSSKLAMYKTVANCLTKVQKSYVKLKWLKRNRAISTEVLRQCFFAYSFPFFAWLFCLFPFLPTSGVARI
jgi:hypothetical protein